MPNAIIRTTAHDMLLAGIQHAAETIPPSLGDDKNNLKKGCA
jgi:hypothetical protein